MIDFNGGGLVGHFEAAVQKTIEANEQVVINGECYSACTLYLRNPNTCVTKNAKLGFHAARNIGPGRPIDVDFTRSMYHTLPPRIESYILAHGGLDANWIVLEGPELWALVKLCPIENLPTIPRLRPDIVTGMAEPVEPWDPASEGRGAVMRDDPTHADCAASRVGRNRHRRRPACRPSPPSQKRPSPT